MNQREVSEGEVLQVLEELTEIVGAVQVEVIRQVAALEVGAHPVGLELAPEEELLQVLEVLPEVVPEVGLLQAGLQVLVVVGQVLLQVEKLKAAQGQKVILMVSLPAVVRVAWFLMNDG